MSLLTFMRQKAIELGLINCPKCGEENILTAISGNCTNCKSSILNIDAKLALQYAIEIIKEFTEKYDEKNPNEEIGSIFLFFDQLISKCKNNEMPTNSEIIKLQSLFVNGNLGGTQFGGLVTIENGKPEINIAKDAPNKNDITASLVAVAISILHIKELNTEIEENLSSDSQLSRLSESLNSSDPDRRLSSLGIIINSMWSKNIQKKSDAIKIVAAVLEASDINMVRKAARALIERSQIGIRYLEMAAANPKLSNAALGEILPRLKIYQADPPVRYNLSKENMEVKVQNILLDALEEAKYHQFSSTFAGILLFSEPRLRYVFDIQYFRQADLHALISFSPLNIDEKCRDDVCIPVVKIFAQSKQYTENLKLAKNSSIPGIRYFGWEVVQS